MAQGFNVETGAHVFNIHASRLYNKGFGTVVPYVEHALSRKIHGACTACAVARIAQFGARVKRYRGTIV